ncbi:hypothetical protein AMIS_3430 [Actinoplanes missouriensis 431]|uniref:Uncharacterized protein n=1 Tax=Actinoplanes missouriensis (strain ATCC 14538 / DSM 43046 / CBS 188.64 / JCM 3121 / NBRC 102363 / NCIMB 12654 / NRRL B-3342 / UNCC 431) TaxID=512565 RepID=I0GXS6_ACTM4|nr:hypothetical protein [Actinoplanes missouriensis]BAL85563.1 hypothetical protein AMIS_3430 [Actinoplanes missouriensis 431]
MVGQTGRGDRAGGFTLLMLCTTASVLLLGVALLVAVSDDLADATLFSRAGIMAVTIGGVVVVCAAGVIAQRRTGPPARTVTVILSMVAAALVACVGFLFLFSATPQLSAGLLLVVAAVLIALCGREAAHASRAGEAR